MSLPTLYYFDAKGRAEYARLILSFAGVEYTDYRFPYPGVPAEVAAKTTFGQVPHYSDGEIELSQSLAIELYLARKYNLLGSNAVDEAKIISYALSVGDIFQAFLMAQQGGPEAMEKYSTEVAPRYYRVWDKILKENGGKHIYGRDNITYADLVIFACIDYVKGMQFGEKFEQFPACLEFHRQMLEVPEIKNNNNRCLSITTKSIITKSYNNLSLSNTLLSNKISNNIKLISTFASKNSNNNNNNNNNNNDNTRQSITSNKISPILPKEYIKISKESVEAKQRLNVDTNIEQQLIDDSDAFFANKSNHQRYFKWLGARLRYRLPTDWYKAKRKDIVTNYGRSLLDKHYKGDHIEAIIANIGQPDTILKHWHFPTLQKQYWNDQTRRQFTCWLAKHCEFGEQPSDQWHYLRTNDFLHNSGNHIIGYYGDVPTALQKLFPEFQWKPWLFERTPTGYFRSVENAKLYLEWLAPQLNITEPTDWYKVTQKDFRTHQGFHLLKCYQTTPAKVVMTVLPDLHKWQSWRFVVIKSKKCNIDYLDDMIQHLRSESKEITLENIEAIGGSSILQHFGGNIEEALKLLENKEAYLASQVPSTVKKDKSTTTSSSSSDVESFEDQYEFIQDEFGDNEEDPFALDLEEEEVFKPKPKSQKKDNKNKISKKKKP
ncbi:hypothetical protein PPL_01815 [Heterostelium album PN500]|uniref:Glutathione S-transferase n=1 Tax=Heterostelium pallidum (strain ATCC 26659 / Pp 5 / PN500) TaxID=670386 RepID=D3B0J8_HETP5|nr:hypothetical protein PPL_01815 [Heterostelium album PN500]EFA84822.1 hypothetical protein PPL_01815 [Heterostelium album PN500]|eukprot:XP_020436933.1 hypothetical protein PPL_01815 [Heterostelium album PN500]